MDPILSAAHNNQLQGGKQKLPGLLKVPPNAKVKYGEPAVKNTAKKGCLFFRTPPTKEKSEYMLPEGIDKVKQLEDISLLSKSTNLVDDLRLLTVDEGQEILVAPFEYDNPLKPGVKIKHPFLFKAFLISKRVNENKRPDMPESLNEVVEIVDVGFVYQKDVKEKEKFVKYSAEDNIFNNLELSSIVQAKLPDCFFLSSLSAILSLDARDVGNIENDLQYDLGKDFIENMMSVQDDGTVIVRLYDPETLKPEYIRVEYSYHHTDNDTLVNHKAPWVHILEKAYAGFGKKRKNLRAKLENEPASFLSIYGDGGFSQDAFTILTGIRGERREIKRNLGIIKLNSFLMLSATAANLIITAPLNGDLSFEESLETLKQQITTEAFINALEKRKSKESIEETFLFRHLGYDGLKELVIYHAMFLSMPDKINPQQEAIFNAAIEKIAAENPSKQTLEAAMILFNQLIPPLSKALIEKLKRVTNDFSGSIFSGQYTSYETELFEKIKQEWEEGKLLTADTPSQFKENVPGLRAGHCYSIVGVFQDIDDDGKVIKKIKLRNPWGKVSRNYNANQEPIEDNTMAESTLDFSDFVKHFGNYTVGTLSSNAPKNEEIEEIVVQRKSILEQPISEMKENDMSELVNELSKLQEKELEDYLKIKFSQQLHTLLRFLQKSVGMVERNIINILNPNVRIFDDLNNEKLVYQNLIRKVSVAIDNIHENKKERNTMHKIFDGVESKKNNIANNLTFESNNDAKKNDEFVFELVNKTESQINVVLEKWPLPKLYEFHAMLKQKIKTDKNTLKNNQHLEGALDKYIRAEKALDKIVKKRFNLEFKEMDVKDIFSKRSDKYLKSLSLGSRFFKFFKYKLMNKEKKNLTLYKNFQKYNKQKV